jgi:hypothetical protein
MLTISPTFFALVFAGIAVMFFKLFLSIFGEKFIDSNPNVFAFLLLSCTSVTMFIPYYYDVYKSEITNQFPKRSNKPGRFEKLIERY